MWGNPPVSNSWSCSVTVKMKIFTNLFMFSSVPVSTIKLFCFWSFKRYFPHSSTWCLRAWPGRGCGTRSTPSALNWPSRMTSCPRLREKSLKPGRTSQQGWARRWSEQTGLSDLKARRRWKNPNDRPAEERIWQSICLGGPVGRRRNGFTGFSRRPKWSRRGEVAACLPPSARVVSSTPSQLEVGTVEYFGASAHFFLFAGSVYILWSSVQPSDLCPSLSLYCQSLLLSAQKSEGVSRITCTERQHVIALVSAVGGVGVDVSLGG